MQHDYEVTPIPALRDNYIWAIHEPNGKNCAIVDPGDARPVIDFIEENDYKLCGILITHHHFDHTDGIKDLIEKYNVQVWGSENTQCPLVSIKLREDEKLEIPELNLKLSVFETPGHTLDHIVFYNENIIFTGDTLFTGGIGRIFEGTGEMMYKSIQKIKLLNPKAKIFCGHEYTLSNLKFASIVEPGNIKLRNRLTDVQEKRAKNLITVPEILQVELDTNPFLRIDNNEIRTAIQQSNFFDNNSNIGLFTSLREWKNQQ